MLIQRFYYNEIKCRDEKQTQDYTNDLELFDKAFTISLYKIK